MFDIFTHVFDHSYSCVEDSCQFTRCTHAGIVNTLQALKTHYKFIREFFVFTILPGVNIFQGWLSLSQNYDF